MPRSRRVPLCMTRMVSADWMVREAVGDEDAGAAGDHAREGEADALLGVGVDRAGGLVEDEDAGGVGERAGEADELLLAGGEGGAALPDRLLEAVREGADEVGDVDLFGGVFDGFVGDPARCRGGCCRRWCR